MFKRKILVAYFLAFIISPVLAQDLPGHHQLKKNEAGEYYVINKENIKMIEASILKMGFNEKWILACIKHKSIDSDLKRWVFVDIKNGGTFDTLHQDNWAFYRDEAYPELKEIVLKDYSDESCP